MGGVGDVITGRVEQGTLKPGPNVVFAPTGVSGKCFSIEMHHKTVDKAGPGDNVGVNVKGLPKENMPKVGDVMSVEGADGDEEPQFIEAGDEAEVIFKPKMPLCVDAYDVCKPLGRMAAMDSNSLIMLGRVLEATKKKD